VKLKGLILIMLLLIFNCGRSRLPFELKEERGFTAGDILPLDINKDRVDELLVVTKSHMSLLDQQGKFYWDFYFKTWELEKPVSLIDFNKDGQKEIFLNFSDGLTQIIQCYRAIRSGDLITSLVTIKGEDNTKDGKWDGSVMAAGGIDGNDDGRVDLLLCADCNFDLQPRGLAVYDIETGKEIWHYWIGPHPTAIILDDLDNDGKPEIVLGTYSPGNGSKANNTVDWESYVIVLDRKGKLKWLKKIGEYFTQTLVAVADLESDGKKEIIIASSSKSKGTEEPDKLWILDGKTGNQKKFIQTGENFWGLACVDLDHDGKDEILTGNSDGKIRVFNYSLDEIKDFQNNIGINLIAACDFQGDGRNEIITNTEDNKLLIFDEKLKKIAEMKLSRESPITVKPIRDGKGNKLLIGIQKEPENEFVLYSFMPIAFAGGKGVLPIIIPLIILIVFLGYLYARKAVIPKIQFPTTELLEKAKEGYIILNKKGKVLFANESAEEILGIEKLEGTKLKERLEEKGITLTLPLPSRARKFQEEGQIIINPPEGEKILSFKTSRVKQGFLLRIEDITKDEHLKRIENWAPVAQKLAHGIKNPLSTILGAVEQMEVKCDKEEGVKRYIY